MNTVAKIVEPIKKSQETERIILFGSYANGTQTDLSDIDLAVIQRTDLSYHQRLKALRLTLRNTIPVDLFVFTPEEFENSKDSNPFIKEIVTQGKVLYEK